MVLPLFFACLCAILSAAIVTFPAITFKELLLPSTTNSTNGPVPVECQQTCAPIVPLTLGNQSCTPSLCCNSQWEQAYFSCIICAAQIQQITDLSDAQHTLDVIYADCTLVGSPIPLVTFPGQSPNRTLPSASVLPSQATATATISGNLTCMWTLLICNAC
ncbi:hypothetical protein M378DRAFT_73868 [Amanita muscaria Koide BX008]|uniref:Extracellular membrane protein CFEM domain-containing protein n=1 Tax=Amanita muscaria (strain Koide BX008) TaxID=946122 RepID=A0A0C2XEY2_AMAMK|nr:hypothetical protein M378DRAFT_73868 [Amanita muscaria Koide BX008]